MFFYMGAYTLNPSDIGNEKIIIPFPTDAIQIAYWNRYTLLHGFFMDLYHWLGGLQQFNYISILANHEDLDEIELRIKNFYQFSNYGFLWNAYFSYLDIEEDEGEGKEIFEKNIDELEFVEVAREKMNQGFAVLIHSYWSV